ncbi:fatty acid desaturase [Nocardia sp. NBC_01009]|uniref:fatty acid desaturase n=1 Tax=Nocardia sp. NBC_01009 TaxID=2975996 RepID=UPI00386A9EFB|nr:fatty acid desaturase [Nocardia sp. NBC_01009]
MVWSQRQARSSRGLPRLIGRAQAFLFFPLLLLEGLNLHVAGVRALRNRSVKHRGLEGALLFGHFTTYSAALFAALPADKAFAFLAVHQGLFGLYMGCIFAPNHKGMPTLTGDDRPDYLRRQVLTSRNVRGGVLTDLALGGLNYQIEHHLFPSMPTRRRLQVQRARRARGGGGLQQRAKLQRTRVAGRHLYRFRSRIRCDDCDRKMEGGTKDNSVWYRCRASTLAPSSPALESDPKTVNLAESRLIVPVNNWIATIFDRHHRAETIATLLAAQADTDGDFQRQVVRQRLAAAETKLPLSDCDRSRSRCAGTDRTHEPGSGRTSHSPSRAGMRSRPSGS